MTYDRAGGDETIKTAFAAIKEARRSGGPTDELIDEGQTENILRELHRRIKALEQEVDAIRAAGAS